MAPAPFDPAIVIGTTGDRAAYAYALAAAKLLEVGPAMFATKVRAMRFLRLAIAHLED